MWLLVQGLGPEIRQTFRLVVDDRVEAGRVPIHAQVLYDTAFGSFRDDRDFLGFFYNEILHQDTCSRDTADGVEVVAWLAVDDRVPAPHRMNLVRLLFAIATVHERHAAECWPDERADADRVSEARARAAVEAVAGHALARWDGECTAVRLALAPLAAVFPAQAGTEMLTRVRGLADLMRGTTAGDLLEFAAEMVGGNEVAVLAAVEHHTGWDTDNAFRGSVNELPVTVCALHLLDQMGFHERRRLLGLLPSEARPCGRGSPPVATNSALPAVLAGRWAPAVVDLERGAGMGAKTGLLVYADGDVKEVLHAAPHRIRREPRL
ncbi:hypothetical protein [Actinomadura sp. 3N508]|uniref:hypothetical protein n=1 Tax=Actinomadura sp. 3N508 TaxID=3375153 RepID=UPI00379830DA